MKNYVEPIAKLINHFTKLPGVGQKTAQRYVYSVIKMNIEDVKDFSASILEVKQKIKYCSVCGNFTDVDPCSICISRISDTICVVQEPKDVLAMEKVHDYLGLYHVLHGAINPMEGKGPNDIRIKELLGRVASGKIKEVIIATNPDVEGEATALYIARLLKPLGIKVTRIAQGISMGSDLEYADEVTLNRAFEDRKEL